MELDKVYDPKKYESEIYAKWEESGAFKPSGKGEPFSIIMPPPNANGTLHLQAVGYVLTDIITRYKRMQGFNTLWLPGTDHAGIETQVVFERDVLAKEGKTRFDLGAEKFYQAAFDFTQSSQKTILGQMRSIGLSADWTKLKFTLDEDIVQIVHETFKKMHEDGMVYRGNRIINWCPACQSGFADIEITHQEREDSMYTINYGLIQIATVRPETIFADVAVAVNPKDARFKELVGREALIPIINKSIPIIADKYVDPEEGTGALKVTPGHDPNDYEIGIRQKLPEISVIDPEGKMINVPEEFAGLDVKSAREQVVSELQASGKLIDTQTVTHRVAVHDRCGTVIEPLISEQWFLRIKKLNQPVIKALENEEVKIFPGRFKKIALNWLTNEHDWNIGRQNWFGIRIPVYYKQSNDPAKKNYIVTSSEAEARDYYGEGNYRAETDTFDTWFSSGQWPYATLMATGDDEIFYPTSLMGTARDILHKWVTRMIMFGLYKTGEVPFRHVYLWGLVTDEHGKKMSKSKGNIIDPTEMTDRYGTDALRLAGALANTAGNDSPMSEKQVAAARNFNNKLWNVSRYVLSKIGEDYPDPEPKPDNLYDEWLITRLSEASQVMSQKLEGYRLNEAGQIAYHLLWDDFADWYIEISKGGLNPRVLAFGLENILKLLHPYVPFVTEAIWTQLPNRKGPLVVSDWPELDKQYEKSAREFEQLQEVVREIRTIKADLDLKTEPLYFRDSKLISKHQEQIKNLTGLSDVRQVEDGKGLQILSAGNEAWLGVDASQMQDYRTKLTSRVEDTESYQKGLEAKLSDGKFRESAPKEVIKDAEQRLEAAQDKIKNLREQLDHIQ